MELGLNLVWLLVCGVIVAAVAPPSRRTGRAPCILATAFACLALLLFPLISMSDDLNAVYDLGDDFSRFDRSVAAGYFLFVIHAISCLCLLHVDGENRWAHPISHIGSPHPGYLRLGFERPPPRS